MRIPLKYNLRSLWVRKLGAAMTAAGIGLIVAIVIAMMALVHGLDSTFVETGHPNHLLVIRKGSVNEVNSFFDRELMQTLRFLPGLARASDGSPLVAGEIVVIINHPRLDGKPSNVMMRGTSELGFHLRPEVAMVEGRPFRHGLREIVVSRSLSRRFQGMRLGDRIPISRSVWTVVGIFDAGGTAYDSEVWGSYGEMSDDWDRPAYSSVLVAAENAASAAEIQRRVADDRRIQLQAVPQRKYFADQTSTSTPIKALGIFIAVVMGVGATFAAMNMMYGALLARSQEIGTLRALGFRSGSVLASCLVESLVLGLAGGVIGCLLSLPIHGITTGTANFMTFNEVLFHFRITPAILGLALAFSAVVGLVGGFFPAYRAARAPLIDVLRE